MKSRIPFTHKQHSHFEGITLIEVLIGVVVSTAIFIVASNLIVSLFGISTKQKKLETLEQSKNDVQLEIGNSVKWANENVTFTGGVLGVDAVQYRVIDGRLYKGDDPLTSKDVIVENFQVTKYSSSLDPVELEAGIGLTGNYFDNENFTGYKITRIDPDIDFDWSFDTPSPEIDDGSYSIRWTGQLETRNRGNYRFRLNSNDGSRLTIDDKIVINKWKDGKSQAQGNILLDKNTRYNIVVEYYKVAGRAEIKLDWAHTDFVYEVIPSTNLYPTSLMSSIQVSMDLSHRLSPDVRETLTLIVSPRSGGVIGLIQPILPSPTISPTSVPSIEPSTTPDTPTPITQTVTPNPSPTFGPSPTRRPTPTWYPSATPRPTNTPRPTSTPRPTNTPTPTPKPLR
ncbi:hypothetical protein IPM62_00240 [Candidatus Woesebacteria bacterium]|nr:MAG: hypothetical protein IPM62_00240 [Candidatus Woesebacteria bacterium]